MNDCIRIRKNRIKCHHNYQGQFRNFGPWMYFCWFEYWQLFKEFKTGLLRVFFWDAAAVRSCWGYLLQLRFLMYGQNWKKPVAGIDYCYWNHRLLMLDKGQFRLFNADRGWGCKEILWSYTIDVFKCKRYLWKAKIWNLLRSFRDFYHEGQFRKFFWIYEIYRVKTIEAGINVLHKGDEAVVIERLQQMESNLNSTSRTLLSRMDIKDASNAKKLLNFEFIRGVKYTSTLGHHLKLGLEGSLYNTYLKRNFLSNGKKSATNSSLLKIKPNNSSLYSLSPVFIVTIAAAIKLAPRPPLLCFGSFTTIVEPVNNLHEIAYQRDGNLIRQHNSGLKSIV
ncbi:hypothetical protein LXL04_020514 [Taraxacum kok-saghyz]